MLTVEDNYPACTALSTANAPWNDRKPLRIVMLLRLSLMRIPLHPQRELGNCLSHHQRRISSPYTRNPPPQKCLTLSPRLPKNDLTQKPLTVRMRSLSLTTVPEESWEPEKFKFYHSSQHHQGDVSYSGPQHVFIQEKQGKRSIVRRV